MPEAVTPAAPLAAPQQSQQPGAKPDAAEKQFRQQNGQFSPKQPIQDSQREVAKKPEPTLNDRAAKTAKPGEQQPEAPQVPAPKKKLKLKIDGVETEEEFGDEDLVRELQMARASRKRMQEAAQTRQQAEELREAFTKRDWKKMQALGVDPKEFSTSFLVEEAQRAMVPPEQLRIQELERENQQLKQAAEVGQKTAAELEQQQADSLTWSQLEPQFIEHAEKAGLPKDAPTMALIASVGLEFGEAGVDLTPDQIVAEVAKRQGARTERYVVNGLKASGGKGTLAWLRRNGLFEGVTGELEAEYRTRTGVPAPKQAAPPPADEPKPGSEFIISTADWNKRMRGGGR